LKTNAKFNDFVLASERTSQVLAQKAGVRVYLGHEMETLHYEDKKKLVKLFYDGVTDEPAVPPVKWIIYGPYEQAMYPNFQPVDNFELVYESDQLKILKRR